MEGQLLSSALFIRSDYWVQTCREIHDDDVLIGRIRFWSTVKSESNLQSKHKLVIKLKSICLADGPALMQ